MSTKQCSRPVRVLCLFLILALFAAACGSASDGDTPPTTGTAVGSTDETKVIVEEPIIYNLAEECERLGLGEVGDQLSLADGTGDVVEIKEVSADVINALIPVCQSVSHSPDFPSRDKVFLQSCEADDVAGDVPYIFWSDDGDSKELVLFGHMMVRLHPVDRRIPSTDEAFTPQDLKIGEDANPRQVVIIDAGVHGDHASEVVAQMISRSTIGTIDVSDPNVDRREAIVESWPDNEIVNVRLPSYGEEDFVVVREGDVLEVLALIKELSVSDPSVNDLVINMSMGGYACKEPFLRAQILELVGQGAVFSVSAGNDEQVGSGRLWPAALGDGQTVITVGSIPAAGASTPSCFSNSGENVSLWVVGQEVLADGHQWSGTSFAAPQVAAALATGASPTVMIEGELEADSDMMYTYVLRADSVDMENASEPASYDDSELIGPDGTKMSVLSTSGGPVTIQSGCEPGSAYAPDPMFWQFVDDQ